VAAISPRKAAPCAIWCAGYEVFRPLSSVATMQWSREERAFAVSVYFSSGRSIVATQRAFRRQFNVAPTGRVPGRTSIVQWVNTFMNTGSVWKQKPGPSKTTRTPENVERVRQAVLQSPKRSARKHASALRISDRTVRRILHQDLKFHPYKLAVVQKLNPRDFVSRQRACEAIVENLPNNALVFFSDEAHFHLSGCVNKQNMRYWSGVNPRELHEKPLHAERVTVWCALSRTGIIGPWFFEENDRAVTVTSERYIQMIQEFFLPKLDELGVRNVWFQQDGATAHTARASMALLREHFPQRLISLRGDLQWPARSPDLAPCDYFLWGYLKSLVYTNRPRTLAELKNNIRVAIADIGPDMLEKVERNFRSRLTKCIEQHGGHLHDVIFKN
jgi:hypothetical protein